MKFLTKKYMKRMFMALALLASSYFTTQAQTIIYVDADATGANNGDSWYNAYTNLQDALLNNDSIGAEIWIAEGVYTPFLSTVPMEIEHGEKLYGGFNGTELFKEDRNPKVYLTYISGDVQNNDGQGTTWDNARRLFNINPYDPFYSMNGEETVVFDGLIFTSTYSSLSGGAGGCIGTNYPGVYQMGLHINNCIFENNELDYCAAFNFYTSYGGLDATQLMVSNSIFRNNFSRIGYLLEFRVTSGYSHTVTFVNNLFENNYTNGGIYGGGVLGRFVNLGAGDLDVQYTNNTFVDNEGNSSSMVQELIAIQSNSTNRNITLDFDNNLFYGNQQAALYGLVTGSSTGLTGVNAATSTNNGGDAIALNSLTNSVIDTLNAPFEDYNNGNYRPTLDFASQGDVNSYLSSYPATDFNGEPKISSTGTIAIGAFNKACATTYATITDTACNKYGTPYGVIYPNDLVNGSYTVTTTNTCGGDSVITYNLYFLDNHIEITPNADSTILTVNIANADTIIWWICYEEEVAQSGNSNTFMPTKAGSYLAYVRIDDIYNESCLIETECFTINSLPVVGVSELTKHNKISIYPNPSTGIVHFNNSGTSSFNANVINIAGTIVYTHKVENNTLNISHLPKGIYIIQTELEGELTHNKITLF